MWSLRNLSLTLILLVLVSVGCSRRVLLREDFSEGSPHVWLLEADNFGRTLIADGRLYVQVNEPNSMQYATLQNNLIEDFVVTVDATLIAGNVDSTYGILFRMQQGGAFYRFDITGRGQYMVERRDLAGNWERFTPSSQWVYNDAIRTGVNEINTMRVAAVGNEVIVSVNGVVLQHFENFDINFGNGSIALDAGTFGGAGTQVAFDNFIIESP